MTDLQPNDEELQATLSYNSVTYSTNRTQFRGLSGSSKFQGRYENYKFEEKTKETLKKEEKYKNSMSEKKATGINKSKLKKKINAFFRLKQSNIFTAFYSISFPLNFPDESAIVVLNSVLTTLRFKSLKFNYIWVAERQKNGTVHFHILINKYLNIRVTNYLFSKAIANEIKVKKLHKLNFNKYAYNGCDVKFVRTQGSLTQYITKYVSKNDEKFTIRGWGSDQITSALFTSISYCKGEIELSDKIFLRNSRNQIIHFGDNFFKNFPLKHPPSNHYMKGLEAANEMIFNGEIPVFKQKFKQKLKTDLSIKIQELPKKQQLSLAI